MSKMMQAPRGVPVWTRVGLAAIALLACSGAAGDRDSGRSGSASGVVQPSQRGVMDEPPPLRPPFRTLPPGASLPTDEECAAAVHLAVETDPENAPFNSAVSEQRLPSDFFAPGSGDPRAAEEIAPRVTGAYTGTTPQILQWVACKWGIDERFVRAQAYAESSHKQTKLGDWSTDPSHCAPGRGLGVDGRPGECPESFGIMQVRYRFFSGAFPAAIESTAFNADTAYAVWRACYEGYEGWLQDFSPTGREYGPGHVWGCIGRWFSGEWYDEDARDYIRCVRGIVYGREPCQ